MLGRLSLKSYKKRQTLQNGLQRNSPMKGRTEIQAAKELVWVLTLTLHTSPRTGRLCVLPDSDKNKLDCCGK